MMDIIATTAKPKLPPKTPGVPLIGSIPGVLKHQIDFLEQAQRNHGNVYKLDLGAISIVMLCNPAYAQYVLRDNARNYDKGGAMWNSVRSMLGNGLVVSEGDFWMRQRRMMQPHFHRQYLSTMTELMISAIESEMKHWDGWADAGNPIDMLQAFNHITMKVIVQTMFGKDLAAEDADTMGTEMAYALDFMLQNMVTQGIPNWIPVPGRKRYQVALKRVDEFLYRIIKQRREMTEQPKDLLGMLLNLIDEETGEAMTDQQVRDEVATMFLAGYETTSLTLSWGVHHLLNHPEVVEKLTHEIDTVLGDQPPTFESLEKLHYTRMVLQEIMRIHPPAYWVPRTALEDDVIDGYSIRAGTMVAVSIYNIHRNPEIWDEPAVFNPERFAPGKAEKRHALSWMPFGAGQRMCIGRDFSLMEGMFIIALMVQRYQLTSTGHVAKPGLSTTLRPKDGVWAKISKRA